MTLACYGALEVVVFTGDSIYAIAYYAIARPSVRLSVCQMDGS